MRDVGGILRTRTKDDHGNELGTFTDSTRPTAAQVAERLGSATNDVAEAVGMEVPAALVGRARSVAALGAALEIELSFFPEQIGTGRSPYEQLKVLYDDRLRRLVTAAQSGGDEDAGTGADAGGPSYAFVPWDQQRRVDWNTNW